MYDNIGSKLKTLAQAEFAIGAIATLVWGIVLLNGSAWGMGLLVLIGGPIAAWISSLWIYGIGEIYDKLCDVEKHPRASQSNNQQKSFSKNSNKNFQNTEKFRGQQVILTEESEIPQVVCPKCGTHHDFDYPKCPKCKYEYSSAE